MAHCYAPDVRSRTLLILRQFFLFSGAALAYFGVRGLTEGDVGAAVRHAEWVLDVERAFWLDIELGIQSWILDHQFLVDLANWIYIWGHWPVVAVTLLWLVLWHRDDYFELRNAMFISGAIGLVIFATFPVAPPRLFSADYIDTVTVHSESYRVLQPPSLVNKYAAVPSLHFGWNLLVALTWYRLGRRGLVTAAAVFMPVAMAFAVVATSNHWTFDVITGAVVALTGLVLERVRRRYLNGRKRRFGDGEPPVEDTTIDVRDQDDEKAPHRSGPRSADDVLAESEADGPPRASADVMSGGPSALP